MRELVSMALNTFQAKTGKPLCDDLVVGGITDIPKAFWKTPSVACVIIESSSNGNGGGGKVIYANLAALETVGLAADQWQQLIMNPSQSPVSITTHTDLANSNNNNEDEQSFTTKPSSSPNTLLIDLPADMKGDKAYEKGYEKKILRQHLLNGERHHDINFLNAHRWKIERTVLVNGAFITTLVGLAYVWKEWALDDTIICAPGGKRRVMINVEALQQAVEEQGNKIRNLKEEQGLGNKDPKVQEAVAELLRLKGLLGEHQ